MLEATHPVAQTAADIDPTWLTGALRRRGHLDRAVVTAVSAAPVGTGQVANCARLTITYDAPTICPGTMIAKTANTDPALRQAIKEHGVYEREVGFYRELAPHLEIPIARAYYADLDVEAGNFVLLLDDLAPAVQGDQIEGCSPEVAGAGVEALVGLHAPRWGDQTLHDLAWLARDRDGERRARLQALPLLWAGFQDRYCGLISDEVVSAGDTLMAHLSGFLHGDLAMPVTITHQDYRLDNMLVRHARDGEPEIYVVDWQTCRPGAGTEDLAYFLGGGLPTDLRREHEEMLVRAYHARLVDAGVRDYSFDDCWTGYRWGAWSGLVMAVYASMIVQQTARGDRMFLTMAERHARHALDLESAAVTRG